MALLAKVGVANLTSVIGIVAESFQIDVCILPLIDSIWNFIKHLVLLLHLNCMKETMTSKYNFDLVQNIIQNYIRPRISDNIGIFFCDGVKRYGKVLV